MEEGQFLVVAADNVFGLENSCVFMVGVDTKSVLRKYIDLCSKGDDPTALLPKQMRNVDKIKNMKIIRVGGTISVDCEEMIKEIESERKIVAEKIKTEKEMKEYERLKEKFEK